MIDAPRDINLDSLLAIFSRWRNDKEHIAQWVDLADYAHMASGAGVMLVGKQGIFGVTRFDPGLSLYYSGRRDFQGSPEQRIVEAFRRLSSLATALFREPEYPAELKKLSGTWDLALNDRLDFPNTQDTDRKVRPAIEAALNTLFSSGGYELSVETDRQKRYGFLIRVADDVDLERLLQTAEKPVG